MFTIYTIFQLSSSLRIQFLNQSENNYSVNFFLAKWLTKFLANFFKFSASCHSTLKKPRLASARWKPCFKENDVAIKIATDDIAQSDTIT